MNINEFTELLKALFRNEKGKPYPIDSHMVNEFFMIFNQQGVSVYRVAQKKRPPNYSQITRLIKSRGKCLNHGGVFVAFLFKLLNFYTVVTLQN